jgi:ribosomal protein L7/L12
MLLAVDRGEPKTLVVDGLRTAFDAAGNHKIDAIRNKIDAIRIVRRVLGIGLKEAKDFVDAAGGMGVRSDYATMANLNAALAERGMTSRFRVAT